MTRCYVFPGQGSQVVGMGEALADAFPVARQVFEEVDDTLGRHLSGLMWGGPMEDLSLTVNTQPALMAHSIAMMRVLEGEADADIASAMFVAGHSLGEYSALCAAKSISLAQAAQLLAIRGEAMQAAVPAGDGAMAALIGINIDGAEKAIAANKDDGICEIANDNAPGQVVISGTKAKVESIAAGAKEHGAKMAKMLPVSAPFHSSLMAPAAEKMEQALRETAMKPPKTPVVANILAREVSAPDEIKALLVSQVTGRVRWTQSVQYMIDQGVDTIIEVGSGKVLTGLIKRISKDVRLLNVSEPGDIDSFAKL